MIQQLAIDKGLKRQTRFVNSARALLFITFATPIGMILDECPRLPKLPVPDVKSSTE